MLSVNDCIQTTSSAREAAASSQHSRYSKHGVWLQQIEYAEKLKREKARNGVIEEQHLEGPYIDVAIPLQCQIDNSRFVFAGGASSSFEQLPGFYNPAPLLSGGDVSLYVLYTFRGQIHEVTVSDCSRLALPLRCTYT
ncbi:DnaJ domain-containing protein, putative [Eimeria praecox]|uniref:DnaJ domain-containing protein, putative n=1 Tax=Eimeria praecox TaxID=51316 RepID=U6G6Z8_9EIME|nr:DnaJ domain-containing protein, putative [Eimeria praecox]